MAVRHKTSNRYDTNLGRNTMGIKFVTVRVFQEKAIELKSLSLAIETDSTIVRNRLVVKNVIFKKYPSSQRMFALANECLEIMNQFGKFQVIWKGRANNVERFGH